MKKLYIVRHSKAVEYAHDNTDFNRCLAEYGIEKAGMIAEYLAKDFGNVEHIVSSPACRALETARIFAKALGYDPEEIITDDVLYHFGGIDGALNTIAAVNDDIQNLFIFGHNPTFTSLAWHLCNDFRDAMPTSAVVGITLDMKSWSNIYSTQGNLLTYLTKKRVSK